MQAIQSPLAFLAVVSTCLPFLFGVIALKKELPAYSMLWGFFAIAAIVDITFFILALNQYRNVDLANYYTLVEYVLIALVLARWNQNENVARLISGSIIFYILIFFLVGWIMASNEGPLSALYVTKPLALLLISLFVLLTLRSVWGAISDSLSQDFRFWTLISMMLYYCAAIVPFAFMSTENLGLLRALFHIHAGITILHNLLFCFGIYAGYKYGPQSQKVVSLV